MIKKNAVLLNLTDFFQKHYFYLYLFIFQIQIMGQNTTANYIFISIQNKTVCLFLLVCLLCETVMVDDASFR